MQNASVLGRNQLFSDMGSGRPFKSYVKTILGLVAVTVWDNFTESPRELILRGDPKRKDEDAIVDIWSEKENVFFLRVNQRHLKTGTIVPYERPVIDEASQERSIEQYTDSELEDVINSKFLALKNTLDKIETIPVLFRMRGLAEEMDKSEKITGAIEARISALQLKEFSTPEREVEPEEE